jgi:hypothetical protein
LKDTITEKKVASPHIAANKNSGKFTIKTVKTGKNRIKISKYQNFRTIIEGEILKPVQKLGTKVKM